MFWIDSVRGVETKVTGDFRRTALGMLQSEVEALLRAEGAIVVNDIRQSTALLVRAESPNWKFGDFGEREAALARNQRNGAEVGVIEVEDLMLVLKGISVFARDPESAPPDGQLKARGVSPVSHERRMCPSCFVEIPSSGVCGICGS